MALHGMQITLLCITLIHQPIIFLLLILILKHGEINNQRVVIDLTHESGYADGMTIDEEGMLWIAFYGGWRVARYDPGTGNLLQQIELPVENVTCCTFGGADLNDLYITTCKSKYE